MSECVSLKKENPQKGAANEMLAARVLSDVDVDDNHDARMQQQILRERMEMGELPSSN